MSQTIGQKKQSRNRHAKSSTVWAAMKERTAQGVRPVRIPPRGDLSLPYPRLVTEARRRQYSESELGTASTMFAKLQRGDDLRYEKVDRIHRAIVADEYENEMKLDIACDRLLSELME